MATVTYDIEYAERRNRLTTAFRIILAIPHLVVLSLWNALAQVLALVQWFIILFTGKRNEGIRGLLVMYLGYMGRVNGYLALMYDTYPPFGTDAGATPVRFDAPADEPPNRLTNALRLIWAIPALVISALISIAMFVVTVVAWFAIVITGSHPRGMFDFALKGLRYTMRTHSYVHLVTDTYPKYE